jgi:uncharacterized YccA/Bax inhibitor family protein
MQSNNPVFRRSDAFNGASSNVYGNQTYPGNGATHQGYGQAPGYDEPQYGATTTTGERMTIDSVVQKTSISLAIVMVFATLTWWFIGDIRPQDNPDFEQNMGTLYLALMIGSFGAFGLSLVNSFKRVVSPALVIAFCALEGVAMGALSKFFDVQFGDGIVTQAVIGTFAAFAGTLAAYKFFNIQVGSKFRTFVIAAMFGMVGLGLREMVLGAFGNQIGLFGFGGIGLLFAIAGLVLGVFMLILDFDFVEQGVAAGIEERESWRAAFALTVSLVWIYTNLLRILAIFSQD